MADVKTEYKDKLLKTIHIQDELLSDFDLFDPKTKEALLNYGKYWIDRLESEKFTLTQLKSITNDILTFWRESIGIATELFWTELRKGNIDFERKDELIFALNKGRFRRVDVGIGAKKDWNIIKDFDAIKDRFSKDEIERITKIIEQDERTRLEILRKCLKNKRIPPYQYLKFGECWAYMSNCGLWDKYFSEREVEELHDIWEGFENS